MPQGFVVDGFPRTQVHTVRNRKCGRTWKVVTSSKAAVLRSSLFFCDSSAAHLLTDFL